MIAIPLLVLLAIPDLTPSPDVAKVRSVGWVRAGADGVGTGFVVDADRRWLLTCRHVIGERKRVEVFFPRFENGELLTEKSRYLGDREELRRTGLLVGGTVLRSSDASDLALVELDAVPVKTRALTIRTTSISPGERVWSLGNRFDVETLWNLSTGTVRQRGRLTDGYFWQGTKLAENAPSLLLDLPIAAADSGGPVFAADGCVIGIIAGTRHSAEASVVIASAGIRSFLGEPKSTIAAEHHQYSNLAAATVWIQPTATNRRCAGVVVDREHRLVLTSAAGIEGLDRMAVVFPLRTNDGGWLGELEGYREPVTLVQAGAWCIGEVRARDPSHDLALLQLDRLPTWAKAVSLASNEPRIGETVHGVWHPFGTEFVWAYAAGVVRQRGGSRTLFQLPAQSKAPGGPIVNDRGELLGVLSTKTGNSQIGYSASVAVIQQFLRQRPFRELGETLRLLRAWADIRKLAAAIWMLQPDNPTACDNALSLDPDNLRGRLCRAERHLASGQIDDAAADIDRVRSLDPWSRRAIRLQADLFIRRTEPKQAAGVLERWLDVHADDAEFRCRLADAWVAAGEEAKAITELRWAVRLDPTKLGPAIAVLLAHVDTILRKYPESVDRATRFLAEGLTSIAAVHPEGEAVARIVAGSKGDDRERLDALRKLASTLVQP